MNSSEGLIKLSVLTPEGEIFASNEVVEINADTESGNIGIKVDHEPLLTVMKLCELQIETINGSDSIVVSGGIIKVELNGVVEIFTDTAKRASDIDLEASERALESAKKLIESPAEEIDLVRLSALIELESLKIRVKRKGLV